MDNDDSLDKELEIKYNKKLLEKLVAIGLTKTALMDMLPGDEPYKDYKLGDSLSYHDLMLSQ